MSTFTQWNGPGEISGRIHIKELTEMYDAFKQLSNEIHAHINNSVGATYTLVDKNGNEKPATGGADWKGDHYKSSGTNWVHGFDKALENVLSALQQQISDLSSTVANKQDDLTIKAAQNETEAECKTVYSAGAVDAKIAGHTHVVTYASSIHASNSQDVTTNAVTEKAVAEALDKYVKTSSITNEIKDGDSNPVTSNAVYDALAGYIPTSKLGNLNSYTTIGAYIKSVADAVAKLPTINSIYGKNEPTDSEKNLLSQIQTATNNISILTSAIKTLFKTNGDGKITTELKPGVFKDMDLAVADFDASSVDVAGQTNTKSLKTDDVYSKDKNYIDVHNDVVFRGTVKVSDKALATEAYVQSQVREQVAAQMGGDYATKTELAATKQALTAADSALTTKIDKTASDIRAENAATATALDNKISDIRAENAATATALDNKISDIRAENAATATALDNKISENKNKIRIGKVPVGDTMRWGDAELESRSVHSTTPFTFTFKGEQHTINIDEGLVKLYIAKNVPEGWHALDGSVELSASEYPELAAVMKENVTTDNKIWLPYVAGQIIKIIA